MNDSMILNIKHCARCNQTHDVIFNRFIQPIEDSDGTIWNFWGMCPINNEPVLMRLENDYEQPK
jgi:hypothetical protein